MHYKPGCRSNSKFGIIVSVTTTLYAALANRYHNKLFFCAGFPLFSKKCWKMPDKTPPWPPRRLGPGTPSGGRGRRNCRKMRKIIHLQHHNKNTSFKKPNFFKKTLKNACQNQTFKKAIFSLSKKTLKNAWKNTNFKKSCPRTKKKH